MKSRIIITWIASIAILPCMLYANPVEKHEQEPTVNIAEQLQDIETHFLKSRERIEKYYAKQHKELKLRAEKEIKQVEETERVKLAKAEEIKKNQYYQTHGFYPRNGLLSQEEIASTEKRIVQKKKSIQTKLERDIQLLEKQRDYTLNNRLPYQEARLKKGLLSPEPEPSRRTVTGIIYGQNKQLALINHEIVKTGDVIHDAKIVAICRNAVKFKKNGTVWEQRPGQSPENFDWQE